MTAHIMHPDHFLNMFMLWILIYQIGKSGIVYIWKIFRGEL